MRITSIFSRSVSTDLSAPVVFLTGSCQWKPLAALILMLVTLPVECVWSSDWSVPIAGNSFPTRSSLNKDSADRESVSIYFHVDRPCTIDLSLRAPVNRDLGTLVVKVNRQSSPSVIDPDDQSRHRIGRVSIAQRGYCELSVELDRQAGNPFAKTAELLVSSDTPDLQLSYVKSNTGNMFYWGRRGPSVHLSYDVPKDTPLRYAYSELTIPVGMDPIGSYFMANGFGEGYFGIQVNSERERRVLFSVWSPFKTDNPRDIPEAQRIVTLAKGSGVTTKDFGNEGSGGQSFLVYPWSAGSTYRFLTEVKPDGQGSTLYTSWFAEKAPDQEWKLIASFKRPQTDTHLRRFHSFLENFSPAYGNVERRVDYSNVWVCDLAERWHPCERARFSVDATGKGKHRLDFTGGAADQHFYLRNGGFFSETGVPGETYTREPDAEGSPKIDFGKLPRR